MSRVAKCCWRKQTRQPVESGPSHRPKFAASIDVAHETDSQERFSELSSLSLNFLETQLAPSPAQLLDPSDPDPDQFVGS